MKAETTRRPLLPAWASALRMKWTRQRCQVALSTLATAALMPSWASEIDELDAAQAAAGELAQERGPERLGLGGADVHAENFAPAVAVDADRDDHRDRDDAAVLAHLHVGGVDPQIGPVALDRAVEEGLHLVVDLLAQPADLALGDAAHPHRLTRSSTERVETPCT